MFRIPIFLVAISMAMTLVASDGLATEKRSQACPPGLAKKSPSCVPPGLAKKGVTASEWNENRGGDDDEIGDADEYLELRTGDRVTVGGVEYIVVETSEGLVLRRDDDYFRLPRDGGEYVRVGDAIIRVDPKTKAVLDIIELADLILN